MSGKIDFTRAFGQVYGEASHTFEQDGKMFDGAGFEVQASEPAPEDAPAADAKAPRQYTKRAKAPEAPPASPLDAELAAQLQG